MSSEVTNADAVNIAIFLGTKSGQALLSALQARRPTITGENMEQIGISGAIAKGWENCIAEMNVIAKEREGDQDLGQSKFIDPSDDNNPAKRPSGKV